MIAMKTVVPTLPGHVKSAELNTAAQAARVP